MRFTPNAGKIRRWREERHWSQEHLAAVAGIGVRTVQRIENGETATNETLMALAAAFAVDVAALTDDAATEAESRVEAIKKKKVADLRLAFVINLASYIFGMLVFAGISFGDGNGGRTMMWPTIWWTIAMAGFGLVVAIVEWVARQDRGHRAQALQRQA
ncbi:helix-turn-helix transcriptional regulator [Sphingomonas sp. AR_OL41]|uniref:helix-turn-helix domain-containing protein n=1 Tax=Sphingomonas sp. AR_OL41 TaxID=3042729 RepID=UPI0024817ABF|nr:helix-turn-helix transcriptional regulator [Sphingomonas sp. AR_OL41]MDH7974537.1 helix-turn-helix transcriptional regulator [Sphingomonas sp. AR_OL41]